MNTSVYKEVGCVAPFSSLHISNDVRPCCVFEGSKIPNLEKNQFQIEELFNISNEKIRLEFLDKGQNISNYSNCKRCSGLVDRQSDDHNKKASPEIDYIKNPTLTYLHIQFNNKCNLACRMCDPAHSNMLFKEFNSVDSDGYIENLSRDSVLFRSILDNLHNIKHLWFSGGEPFLHDEVWEILELMYEKNLTKDLTLQVNTNGTVKLTQHRLDILNSCKQLEMHISMDGFEKYAEYIRTGVVWDRWVENIKEYKKIKHRLNIVITITVFNAHILDKMIELFEMREGFGLILNMVFSPYRLSVINMNQYAKDYLNEKYKDNNNNKIKELLYFINNNKNNIDPKKVIEYIDVRDDRVVKNNIHKNFKTFKEVDPIWYELLKC